MDSQPRHLRAGDRIPLTPQELIEAGVPVGSVVTANLVNGVLDRMRAASPDGELPPHIQARIDAGEGGAGWSH
ncbi:hypothetical protein [Micromonospora chokoriensis]|uniref:hypothetical protein n=1 Tax=Micromonospora chokoriensis TaxID=356851 RepID=UPI0012FAB2C2|nr:hypothetical protein [Micromonospora chokoriensis]